MSSEKKSNKNYNRQCRDAVSNPVLKEALNRTTERFCKNREKAFSGFKDVEGARTNARRIKELAIEGIDENIELFKKNFEEAGGTFYHAKDASSARRHIVGLLKKKSITKTVKSKSLATEEIGLNKALAENGINAVETDLGEWIIQLRDEKPSHIILPAMHLTKEEIARTFEKVEKKELSDNPDELVKVARRRLRQEFINAEAGITGSNFLIADTGTIVVLSNEGNARLCSSLPPIHIAVVGMEKVIGTMGESVPLIQLLTRNATGQKITSYISYITGPSRTADIELNLTLGAHGPEEAHLVMIDNGRSEILADEDFREILYCLRCGACLNVCPVFREIGGHVFGNTYMGGIGVLLTYFIDGPDKARTLAFSCTGCGECADVCPVKIDIPELILKLRKRYADKGDLPWFKKLLFKKVIKNRSLFEKSIKAASIATSPYREKDNTLRHLPLFFSGLSEFRKLPAIAEVSFREIFNKIQQKGEDEVILFPGCLIEFVYPHIGEKIVHLLNNKGKRALFPENLNCCGYPLIASGDWETSKELAINNVEILKKQQVPVITACPTCLEAISGRYPEMLGNKNYFYNDALNIAKNCTDISHYLFNALGYKAENNTDEKVTYHTPCHLKKNPETAEASEELIRKSKGENFIEMKNSGYCCGAAGSFAVEYPPLSGAISKRKIELIEETDADTLLTSCPGCMMQIEGALKKLGKDIKTKHIVEIL